MSFSTFSRVVNNHAKLGFYPTDNKTLSTILNRLSTPLDRFDSMRMIDPCCGEGFALKQVADHAKALMPATTEELPHTINTLGIEIDRNRSVKAKEILDDCIRSDIEDFYCEGESCSLLFLNPPYGDSLKNKYSDKSKRLETLFLRDTLQLLQYGGVLVFIVPLSSYSDAYLCELLITNFKEIRIWMAPDQTYKQTVLMAYRKHATPIGDNKDYKKQILIKDLQLMSRDALESDNPDDLFTSESKLLFGSEAKEEQKTGKLTQYIIPPTLKGEINYYKISLDIEHLMQDVLEQKQIRKRSSWDLPEIKVWTPCDPPLMPMTPWHVALSIASGQMNGLFRLNEETQILIKGQTFKSSVSKEKIEEIISDQKMSSKHIVEVVDVFKPCVMGLVFGGNNHGSIVHFE